jgi:hypothetical protein
MREWVLDNPLLFIGGWWVVALVGYNFLAPKTRENGELDQVEEFIKTHNAKAEAEVEKLEEAPAMMVRESEPERPGWMK